MTGWTLADRNYGSPRLAEQLQAQEGGCWPHPVGAAAWGSGHRPGSRASAAGSATVIGQLTGRYQQKRVWARDAWHLWSRWQRKLPSHTLAVSLCQQTGLGSLRFADLLSSRNPHTGLANGLVTAARGWWSSSS